MTIQLAIYYILLVSHWRRASIFNRSRYLHPNISGSRPWSFRVTWRHRSCDHLIPQVPFPIRALLQPTLYLQLRDNGPQIYLGHDLDLCRSRDVIGHMTNRSDICHFLLVSHWNRISIFNRFRDICIQIYLGQDLDLSRSHYVIGQVTIWFPRCHFL